MRNLVVQLHARFGNAKGNVWSQTTCVYTYFVIILLQNEERKQNWE
jgi:hypothetical protein